MPLKCITSDFHHPDFEGASATIEFLKIYDALFDIMNSCNPFGRGSKTPLKKENEYYWRSLLEEAKQYSKELKNEAGITLHTTRNKTPFVGFLVNIYSYQGIYEDYVKQPDAHLKYVLTYKTSQDNLELFFLNVRYVLQFLILFFFRFFQFN